MFDPPITSGANLFIIVALTIIAAGAAIVALDVYKDLIFKKDKSTRILTTREPTFGLYGKKIRKMLALHKDPYSDADKLLDLYALNTEEK